MDFYDTININISTYVYIMYCVPPIINITLNYIIINNIYMPLCIMLIEVSNIVWPYKFEIIQINLKL